MCSLDSPSYDTEILVLRFFHAATVEPSNGKFSVFLDIALQTIGTEGALPTFSVLCSHKETHTPTPYPK